MSSEFLLDCLCEDHDFVVWAIYHYWGETYEHKGFRIGCMYQGQYFNWDPCELNQIPHRAYSKIAPQCAKKDTQARKKVLDFVKKNVNYDDLHDRARVAQTYWRQIENLEHPGPRLQGLVEQDRQQHIDIAKQKRRTRIQMRKSVY